MDIRERIKNVMIDALVEAKLKEAVKFRINTDDSDEIARIKAIANKRDVEERQGPRTRRQTLGRRSAADVAADAAARAAERQTNNNP